MFSLPLLAAVLILHSPSHQAAPAAVVAARPAVLAQFVGTWSTHGRVWMNGPKSTPVEDRGVATFRWSGRSATLIQETEGTQLGQPFSAVALWGIDSARAKLEVVWSDNSTAAFFKAEGAVPALGGVATLYGQADDAANQRLDRWWRIDVRHLSAAAFAIEFHDLNQPPDQTLVFETTYTRTK